ncbi:hypothetical protein ACFC1R_21230 [Kitasatospora sp. NPDC056138]|uniref:hypothetical protein n=1 Tax=Kitasatospora sp. NPDC056138 TaxID=3345724 RepID=UPI0035DE853B
MLATRPDLGRTAEPTSTGHPGRTHRNTHGTYGTDGTELADRTAPGSEDAPLTALRGDFEVHLTVRPGAADALAHWAAGKGLKFTHILLDRGAAVSQPMLTLRSSGSFAEVAEVTRRTAEQVTEAGFAVLRVKVEAVPWAAGVPQSDADAARLGADRYFEHHVKLLLSEADDTNALAELAARHSAHLSRNARRVRADGLRERFVTQRCRLTGLATAGRRLDALVAELTAEGHQIASMEREFVALDSDETLDAGWIDENDTTENDTTEQDREREPR